MMIFSNNSPQKISKCLVLSNQESKAQIYLIYYHKRRRKPENESDLLLYLFLGYTDSGDS